jgi:formylglycine-generating enzyme
LYDMHGNLHEYCQDWWDDHLPGGTVIDPQWPDTGSLRRVLRGGCVGGQAWECRSANRSGTVWFNSVGFRVVLAPGQP